MTKVILPPTRGWLWFRIIAAAVGISAGLMVGIYFIREQNWHVVVWGFVSSVWALAAMLLHIAYKRGSLRYYSSKLRMVSYIGAVGQLLGVVSFVVYIILGIVFHDDLKDMRRSYFVASVWGFMTWKWSFVLFWYAREYRHLMLEEALIPVGGEDSLYSDSEQGTVVKAPEVSFS